MTEPRHTHCIPVEGLGELEALSPEHPWRRHLADCPHCRALLAAYRGFVDGDAAQADATREARLAAFIEREIAGQDRPEAHGLAPRRRRGLPRWLAPALGVAAVGFIAIGLWPHAEGPEPRLGEAQRGPNRSVDSLVVATRAEGVLLRWQAPVDGERAEVLVFDATVNPRAAFRVGDADSLLLTRGRLDSLRAGGGALYWRVRVETPGGPAESAPQPLPEPRDQRP
ncbi:hypothetical protein KDL67_03355 [bacterium]|nr:hypothetical protein [bacterium]